MRDSALARDLSSVRYQPFLSLEQWDQGKERISGGNTYTYSPCVCVHVCVCVNMHACVRACVCLKG